MQLLSALSSTASPLAMQVTPMAGVAADAFAALFAGIVPDAGDGRQAAAEGGKALPVAQMPPVATADVAVPAMPVAPEPVVAPLLPVSASEAIAMVPADPAPPPAVRDAVPVVVAAGVVGALKLLPEDAPVAVRPPEPKPELPIQPMPARFAPPLPVRARRPADEPALPTPESDEPEAAEDGDAPILIVPNDAPPIDLPPMVAIPADALAPVPADAAPKMKVIGPKVPDAEPTVAQTTTPPQTIPAAAPVDARPTPQDGGRIATERAAPAGQAAIDAPRATAGDAPEVPVTDPVTTMPSATRPVRTQATRQRADSEAAFRPDTIAVPTGTPDTTPRRPVAPGPIGNIRRSDQPSIAPAASTPAPAARFAPVDRRAQPSKPVVDPVRAAWQVETPAASVAMPADAAAELQTVFMPVATDPVGSDVSIAPNQPVAHAAPSVPPIVAQALPPTMQPQPAPPDTVAPVAIPPVVQTAPRRAAPRAVPIEAPVAEASPAPVADASVPVAESIARPAERAPIAEPVRAPIVDAATRLVDPVVIDQPAVAFTLPTERAPLTQPTAEPLTANRQTIAGEASAPVVSVAAPTVQPIKSPPVTRVASATAPEAVAEVVLADAPAPRPRRDDDAPPLPTPAAPSIDAATLRPVAAPATVQQPQLDTRQPQWMEGMIDRIETLRDASPTQGETRIRLSPDALGDVEVAIRTSEDGRIHVHFSSDNADAGRLLADAQPRLVQLAEARGLKLGGMQVDVGTQQQPSQRQAQDQGSPQPRAPRSAFADAQAPSTRTDNRIA
ncbi:flagellar hook-length control protein FliK [Sphingomonas sp. T9W2]|uniref:flagellar hook-length control protein FliK n=1 Tax=Sphingomonas sp. T9W2 TaxID=3143183 RepID=UPI0031F54EAA